MGLLANIYVAPVTCTADHDNTALRWHLVNSAHQRQNGIRVMAVICDQGGTPVTKDIEAARLYFAKASSWHPNYWDEGDVNIHLVDAAGLSNPIDASAFGFLHHRTQSLGFVTWPYDADYTYKHIDLDESGIALINQEGLTSYAFRAEEDVAGALADKNAVNIEAIDRYAFQFGTAYIPGIITGIPSLVGPKVTFVGHFDPEIARRLIYLHAETDGAGSFSNCDFRFRYYRSAAPGVFYYTAWQKSLPWNEDICATVHGLVPNAEYRVQLQMRLGTAIYMNNGSGPFFNAPAGLAGLPQVI